MEIWKFQELFSHLLRANEMMVSSHLEKRITLPTHLQKKKPQKIITQENIRVDC